MLFDFVVMQAIYLSLARGSAEPLEEALRRLPKIPKDTQWANFLRNHDELTLDKLTVSQRAEVFAAFGPEAAMQLYGHGLRRRLAPMLDGDQRRLRMLFASSSACPARQCCSTATRSGWETTCRCRTGLPCARRCSGRQTPA